MRQTQRIAIPLFQQHIKACCQGNLTVHGLKKAISRIGRRQSIKLWRAENLTENKRGYGSQEKEQDFSLIAKDEDSEEFPHQASEHRDPLHLQPHCYSLTHFQYCLVTSKAILASEQSQSRSVEALLNSGESLKQFRPSGISRAV